VKGENPESVGPGMTGQCFQGVGILPRCPSLQPPS